MTVSSSTFYYTSEGSGGAIYFTGITQWITDTTFLLCSATSEEGCGGAIDHRGGPLSLTRCFLRETRAFNCGSGLYVNGISGESRIIDISFGSCTDYSSSCAGTVFVYPRPSCFFSSRNFSECKLLAGPGHGTVLYAASENGSWTFEHCTVWKCNGESGISSETDSRQQIYACNFYDSITGGDSPLLLKRLFRF
jgi:hypothetical protein